MNIYLIFILLLGFYWPVYASDCQKQFKNNQTALSQNKEIGVISRENFAPIAIETIAYEVQSVFKKGETASFKDKNVSAWIRRLQKRYNTNQSTLPFEVMEFLSRYAEFIFGRFQDDQPVLVFTKNNSWLKRFSKKQRRQKIKTLKQLIQVYNKGDFFELNSRVEWYIGDFPALFKTVVFAFMMRFSAEHLQELLLDRLNQKENKLYLNSYGGVGVLKKVEIKEDMRLFLYNLVQSMSPLLLKKIIMQYLFIDMRLYVVDPRSLIRAIAPTGYHDDLFYMWNVIFNLYNNKEVNQEEPSLL